MGRHMPSVNANSHHSQPIQDIIIDHGFSDFSVTSFT